MLFFVPSFHSVRQAGMPAENDETLNGADALLMQIEQEEEALGPFELIL